MNTRYLTVLALVKAQPGREQKVREELLSLVAPSRKDEGCVSYELHQGAGDRALFYFHENWTSKELLDRHLQTPHVQSVLGRVGQMVAEPPQIMLWEKISPDPV